MQQKIRTNTVYRTMWVDKPIADWKAETGVRWNNIAKRGMQAIKANWGTINEQAPEGYDLAKYEEENLSLKMEMEELKIKIFKLEYTTHINTGMDENTYYNLLNIRINKFEKYKKEYEEKYENPRNQALFKKKKEEAGE